MRSSLLFLIAFTVGACSSTRSDSAARVYRCESGRTVAASYPTDSTAVVEYEEEVYRMTVAISASGARYVGDGLVWWTKGTGPGSEGTLFRQENAAGATSDVVERCTETEDGDGR